MKRYDLTTKEGVGSAIADNMWHVGILSPLLPIAGQSLILLEKLLDKLFTSTEEQSKAVSNIIKNGKDNGIDKMEIIIQNTKGFKLNVPLEDVKIDTIIGTDEKMKIKVKYK